MNKRAKTENSQLRERAEKAIAEGLHSDRDSFGQIKDYLHELQVYQAELEIQADELRRTQAELEAARDEFFELYDNAPIGYLSINEMGIIVRANETVAGMLHSERENLIHKPLSRFIVSRDHSLFFATCKKARSSEQFRSCELCFRRTDHGEFYGRIDLIPVHKREFATNHYRVTLVDITERKQAELEKLRMEREVLKSQKEESLKRLAGGIAHNFNNILTSCIGNIDLLQTAGEDADLRQRCLKGLAGSTARAAELSNLMLHYLGQALPERETLDLVETISGLKSILRSTIPGQIELSFQATPGPILVKVDRRQLAQVLNNLIVNGIEAIGKNQGSITVKVGEGFFRAKDLPFSVHGEKLTAGNYACLEVCDTGCGMDDKTLLHAIDPFFTTNFTGRGLGLSAVWGTVHAHDGYFYMKSCVDHGTTVKVLIPILHPNTQPEGSKPASASLEVLSGRTVLYVDDDPIVRTIGKVLLEETGSIVIEAGDGISAVKLFQRHQDEVACVVLDFAMPNQDGDATLEELRRLNPRLPVLLVSGYLETNMERVFVVEKPNAFLQKPFDRKKFRQALRNMLSHQSYL